MDVSPISSAHQSNIQANIQAGQKALEIEISGLESLKNALGQDFAKAVDLCHQLKGRVIVTGMGKSGHIGCKIAATLASTGTPSYFVHPGEASHGDLGMITPEDAVLALSNSGKTSELGDIITYSKRYKIPLIAITGGKDSPLGNAADILLLLPDADEACPMGLAPTTSTTQTLALGDALAVALIDKRNFSATDFKVFHPGGKLGSQLAKVSDLMHSFDQTPILTDDQTMSTALLEMTAKSFGCVGITGKNNQNLLGVITDGDLRRHMDDQLMQKNVSEVMSENPLTIGPDHLAAEALAIMNERTITSLFVTEDKKPVGILHIHDCLRAGLA